MAEEEEKEVAVESRLNSTEDNPFGSDSVIDMWSDIGGSFNPVKAIGETMTLAELMGFDKQRCHVDEAPQPAQLPGGGSSSSFGFSIHVDVPREAAKPEGSKPVNNRKRALGRRDEGPSTPRVKRELGADSLLDSGKKQKTAGRPKKDVDFELAQVVKAFQDAASTDSTFFGEHYKVRARNLKRLLDFADERQRSSDCSIDEARILSVACKKVVFITHVCKFVSSYGVANSGFATCFDEQSQFLSLEPKADFDMPSHLLKARHDARVRSSPPSLFFEFLGKDRLLQEGYSESEVSDTIVSACEERVMSLVKSNACENVGDSLRKQFVVNCILDTLKWEKRVKDDANVLAGLVWHHKMWDDAKTLGDMQDCNEFLESALACAADAEKHRLVAALGVHPRGREELRSARSLLENGKCGVLHRRHFEAYLSDQGRDG